MKAMILSFINDMVSQNREKLSEYFAENAEIHWPNTKETFSKERYIKVNCEYPNKWLFDIKNIYEAEGKLIAITRIWAVDDSVSVHAISIFELDNNKITKLTEYWSDDGEVPEWRKNV